LSQGLNWERLASSISQRNMRILIVHPEARFYGGAERVLDYYSTAASRLDLRLVLAKDSRLDQLIPRHVPRLHVPDHTRFRLKDFAAQVRAISRLVKDANVELLHGWAARDWPLVSLAARLGGVPAIGTLHDDPESHYIRPGRRRLMRWNARVGLDRIVCVSDALRQRCLTVGYASRKLETIRNGLPPVTGDLGIPSRRPFDPQCIRIGYLGAFSKGKGTDRLLALFDHVWQTGATNWELILGGSADVENLAWWEATWMSFARRPWCHRMRTVGWVQSASAFFDSIDLLIFPSRVFDCLPTVLIEAARSGVPALAANVGGAGEIVVSDQTGWLFTDNDQASGGGVLQRLLASPGLIRDAGANARRRAESLFSSERMVDDYLRLYRDVLGRRAGSGVGTA
jgi:glycosyltransferase involved in cell wall biosynthesis